VGECLHRSPRRLRPRPHRPGHAAYISGHLPRPFRTKRAAVSEEKRPLSSTLRGEGRRTRTFNQRIKSFKATIL
jgi:hypothetical protein